MIQSQHEEAIATEASMGKIQSIFYSNPDIYPPIINSCRLLAQASFDVELFCSDDLAKWEVNYSPRVHIHRVKANGNTSGREYLGFVGSVLRHHSAPRVFIGHDMHGFLVARLQATRYRRPLVYHCHDFAETGRPLSRGGQIARLFQRRLTGPG